MHSMLVLNRKSVKLFQLARWSCTHHRCQISHTESEAMESIEHEHLNCLYTIQTPLFPGNPHSYLKHSCMPYLYATPPPSRGKKCYDWITLSMLLIIVHFYHVSPQPLPFWRKQSKFVQLPLVANTLSSRQHSAKPLHPLQSLEIGDKNCTQFCKCGLTKVLSRCNLTS